jgi:hypothetical protein
MGGLDYGDATGFGCGVRLGRDIKSPRLGRKSRTGKHRCREDQEVREHLYDRFVLEDATRRDELAAKTEHQ